MTPEQCGNTQRTLHSPMTILNDTYRPLRSGWDTAATSSRSSRPATSNERAALHGPEGYTSTSLMLTLDAGSDHSTVTAITESRGTSPTVGLAFVDLSTARAILCQIVDNQTYTRTIHKLWVWGSANILMPSTALSPTKSKLVMFLNACPHLNVRISAVDRRSFNESQGQELIVQLARSDELGALKVAVDGQYYAISCLAAALDFIHNELEMTISPKTLGIHFESSEGSMMLDLSSVHSLEIVQNLHNSHSPDCLFGIMNETQTAMGSRLLRGNILQPLLDAGALLKRYEAVEELSTNERMFSDVRKSLRGFLDVDKALTNIVIMPAPEKCDEWLQRSINHILVLKTCLASVKQLPVALGAPNSILLRQVSECCTFDSFLAIESLIDQWINEDTIFSRRPAELQAQRIFAVRSGSHGLLDVARRVFKETLCDIHEYCEEVRTAYNINFTLEFDSKRGRFLRIPANELEESLDTEFFIHAVRNRRWIECQTMDLVKLNNKLACSQTEILNMSKESIRVLIGQLRTELAPLFRVSDSVALLDVLTSFASVAMQYQFVKPVMGLTLAVKAARHPIQIKASRSKMIPNDCYASNDSRLQIITGCNMSGKSTYVRTIALLQIMAQSGSFVPAEYASFPIRTQIFARISVDDNIAANMSTFAKEMREVTFILKNITPQSLVLIDELGRGTSTSDGLAVAVAIAERLHASQAYVWFVTHFHDLAKYFRSVPGAVNFHLAADLRQVRDKMLMLYRVASGPVADISYGILVAQVTDFPASIVKDAEAISEFLRKKKSQLSSRTRTEIQHKKRRLLLGLEHQLLHARSADICSESLAIWLKALQEEFIEQLSSLESEEEAMTSKFVRSTRKNMSSNDLSKTPSLVTPSVIDEPSTGSNSSSRFDDE